MKQTVVRTQAFNRSEPHPLSSASGPVPTEIPESFKRDLQAVPAIPASTSEVTSLRLPRFHRPHRESQAALCSFSVRIRNWLPITFYYPRRELQPSSAISPIPIRSRRASLSASRIIPFQSEIPRTERLFLCAEIECGGAVYLRLS